ncbi:hypothetical protein GUJ93_ZPchr0002g24485 [Zizania palustris]|uniref:Uncharacterized protein n=1 Tax=Zizania palustris TaxID=103762 RepID=A0A8J5RUW2_ZIZPA|nr:hypothetical protein GUJ93_ZPchr0002g24485 [Zizania palustris]
MVRLLLIRPGGSRQPLSSLDPSTVKSSSGSLVADGLDLDVQHGAMDGSWMCSGLVAASKVKLLQASYESLFVIVQLTEFVATGFSAETLHDEENRGRRQGGGGVRPNELQDLVDTTRKPCLL